MGLFENMQKETVAQLNQREPVTGSVDDPLQDAVRQMIEKKLGCVVVVDEERKPIGMFTESMLTQLLANKEGDLVGTLGDHMAQRCPSVKITEPVADVLEAMELKNVRFLCVVDDDGVLVGLTGQKGLLEYVADHFPEQVMVQRIGETPYTQGREGA